MTFSAFFAVSDSGYYSAKGLKSNDEEWVLPVEVGGCVSSDEQSGVRRNVTCTLPIWDSSYPSIIYPVLSNYGDAYGEVSGAWMGRLTCTFVFFVSL